MSFSGKLTILISTAVFLAFFSSCYENIEGCIDVRAVNYDLDADRSCPDCCQFPSLRVLPDHQRIIMDSTISLDLDEILFDDFGQPYRIEQIRFFLSDFALIQTNGGQEQVSDSISVQTYPNDETVNLLDDITLINANLSRTIEVGNLPNTGTFDRLALTLGLNSSANSTIPNSAPTDHPLNLEEESMWLNTVEGYAMAQISLFQDTTAADTIPIEFSLRAPDAMVELDLALPLTYSSVEGFNTRVNLTFDYAALFSGVNIQADTLQLQEKMTANLPQVISVTNIVAESQ